MSENSEAFDPNDFVADVPDDLILYRAYDYPKADHEGKIGSGSFISSHEDGCSLFDTIEACQASVSLRGVASIKAAEIGETEARVVRQISEPGHYRVWGKSKIKVEHPIARLLAGKADSINRLPPKPPSG